MVPREWGRVNIRKDENRQGFLPVFVDALISASRGWPALILTIAVVFRLEQI
jgi:hypothetical protein